MTGSPRNKYVQSGQVPVQSFQPNGPYYRSCCCHVRKLTIIFGIIEIFLVCFMIVAVIPDLSVKICHIENVSGNSTPPTTVATVSTVSPGVTTPSMVTPSATTPRVTTFGVPTGGSQRIPVLRLKRQAPGTGNNTSVSGVPSTTKTLETSTFPTTTSRNMESTSISPEDENATNVDWYNTTGIPNPPLKLLRYFTCECNVMWLSLALIHILSANMMFYGLKSTRWYLFLPHITMRCLSVLVVLLFCGFLLAGFFFGQVSENVTMIIWILVAVGLIFCLPYCYIIFIEIKCIHFVKMSAETGFSISNTRPIGPPTLSLSESRPPPQAQGGNGIQMQNLTRSPQPQELPPLRHTYGTGNVGN